MWLWLFSSPAWSQYGPTSGPYKVLTLENIVLHDPVRHKNIPIKIYYPAVVERFTVIIFSHGGWRPKILTPAWANTGPATDM